MCGIAGLIDLKGGEVRKETIKAMTDAIKHRGPDGEGQWVHENVGIGHRRLAIIDLSEAASQPMLAEGSRYVLSYNGEIYNYIEIRKELQSLGVKFHSKSDSEVLLQSLIYWREKALTRLNGMFAFAFYDSFKGDLLLARDRYGIKPLYYSLQDSYFAFGSEQKAIKSRSSYKSNLDKEALLEYMTFQNIFTDKTFEVDIKLLQPGHFLHVCTREIANPIPKPTQYWDYHFTEPEKPASEREYVEELNRLFVQAVNRNLASDVEIGSYLSGGMDSGSITAVAAGVNADLKTFTVGFDLSSASGIELGFDERAKAEAISAQFKTEHYEIILKAGDMEKSMKKLMWHLEEPRVGQSYPNLYAAKLASKWVKVVLSGAGGDELFGGYPWRYYQGSGSTSFQEYIDGYYGYWQRLVDNKNLIKIFEPMATEISGVWTRDIFENVFRSHANELKKPEDYVNHSMYFEAKTFLHSLLVVEDKLSMAYGLETRVPFLDNDLVDFAMNLPVNLKVRNLGSRLRMNENEQTNKVIGYQYRTNDGKYILRETMRKHLPNNVTENPKQGFSAPDESWFRGESMNFVKEQLLKEDGKLYKFFDFKTTRRLVSEHLSGIKNRRLFIWSLLSLVTYLDIRDKEFEAE
jgi:asparagine synthase (glutamine-hydrolysing)